MSRAWRIEYEGALYHLLSRGNDGSAIFVDDKDRSRFLDAGGEMSQRFDIDIYAYVLMDNHYHSRKRKSGYAALWYLENRPTKKAGR
jgi:REP element-mobilizing transposase RayT